MQITDAERHGIVRKAVTAMNTATAGVDGGRERQLEAVLSKINWLDAKPIKGLKLPLLVFVLPASRYDAHCRSVQRYTGPGMRSADVRQVC